MIARIDGPLALPLSTDDYVAQNNLMATSFLGLDRVIPVVGGQIPIGAIFQIGGTVYLCTAAENITGGASAYVKITPAVGGATCTASYVANLTGVTWNTAYNGWYDVGGALYVFNELLALLAGQIVEVHRKIVEVSENGSVEVKNMIVGGTLGVTGVLTPTGGVKESGAGGLALRVKVIPIGNWNMDIVNQVNIAHGLIVAQMIAVLDVQIIDDNNLKTSLIGGWGGATTVQGGYVIDATWVSLLRTDSSQFNAATFDSVPFNRGFITLLYYL